MSRIQFLLPLILPYALAPAVMAATPAPSGLPQVDFSKMGSVALGGSFAGLDWWSENSPFSSSSSGSASSTRFSSDGATVFYRDGNGQYRPLGSTEGGGQINALCWADGPSSNGTLIIGGSFDSIAGEESANIISYDLSASTFDAISPGLSGPVHSLYCDNERDQVWVGGSFEPPSGEDVGGNVALWSMASSSWVEVDFGGLNGPVEDIALSAGGDSIYFAGDFTTTFISNSSSNSTTNITSIPSAPNGTSTIGHSGYLTPVTLPPVSSASGNLTVSVGPTTDQTEYSNPDVLLCPGEGVWLARDNSVANVDLLGYNFWRASGVRVKNGLVQGRGTTHFCITSIPDNLELNMTYTDPETGKNETCDAWCPLYTDPSIEAQDFIFTDGTRNMTGMQMQLKEWQGEGSGLAYVQLLSDGAYGSAATEGNRGVCPGRSDRSSIETVGEWSTSTTKTSIPATVAYYRSTTVSAASGERPQMTFYPYVASTAYYEVYLYIPGCTYTGDCDSRTTVDMEVFPRQGGLGWTSTISQQVQEDTRTLVYSGPIDMTSEAFSPTVILALAADPATTSDDQYTIVASGVELVLTGLVDANGSSIQAPENGGVNGSTITNTTRSTNSSMRISYGVFEYAFDTQYNVDAATARLSNSTETALTQLGFALSAARNESSSQSSFSVHAITSRDDMIYVAGNFSASGNFSNVLSIDSSTNATASLASGGLDGVVYAAAAIGNYVYFGGAFASTAEGDDDLNHLARYDPGSDAWAALGGGVDGVVTDLVASASSNTQLIVLGNFSRTLDSDGSSSQSGGYAIWDTSSNAWTDGGVLFGNITSAASASGNDNLFLAGRVYGTSSNPANGIAMLSSEDGVASITSLDGVNFGPVGSTPSPSARKRSLARPSLTRTWLSRFTDALAERSVIFARATAPTLDYPPAPAPAVLAGGFWRNSSDDDTMVTIMGGNFSSSGSTANKIGSLAFYSDSISGPTPPVTGVVRAVQVISDHVYLGGSDVEVEGVGSNLVVYNLAASEWQSGNIPTLNPSTGSSVNVNIIRAREETNTVIVAGNFATAGSLDCSAVCLWDTETAQWTTPGSGLSSGEVRALDFAGENYETIIVAGAFVLGDAVAYVASYNFDNSSWRALDGLPGPALAVATDNKNASSIYAAGYADDTTTYLRRWDGSSWTEQNSTLLPGSLVQQLAFVPLSSEHSVQGPIERDRMLMISGELYLDDVGNVTSALYDGTNWHPYLVGTSSTGTLASGSALFWSESTFDFSIAHYLARGLVVLVAIAIATGLILLLILLFFLVSYCARRSERNQRRPETFEKEGSEVSSTRQNVFHNVQAALEQSLVGGTLGGGAAAAAAAAAKRRSDPDSFEHVGDGPDTDGSDYEEAEGEGGRETTMRYDFDGPDLQSGELAMRSGQRVIIVDDVQSDEWWFARDPATGREGVVPATYVW